MPGNAELKTSGMALRKADWLFKGTAVDPREVQLLFVPKGKPYTFTNAIGGRTVTHTVVPHYRFIWQVQGVVDTVSRRSDTIVALLDYATGAVLYDVRDDLRPADLVPEPTATPSPRGRRRPSSSRRRRRRRRRPAPPDAAGSVRLLATAVYDTSWFKAIALRAHRHGRGAHRRRSAQAPRQAPVQAHRP